MSDVSRLVSQFDEVVSASHIITDLKESGRNGMCRFADDATLI